MATNKNTKPQSRVSKNTKKSGFKFRWWIVLILVLIIAVVGIVILRYSNAAIGGNSTGVYYGFDGSYDIYAQYNGGRLGPKEKFNNLGGGYFVNVGSSPTRCFAISATGQFKTGTRNPLVNMSEIPLALCSG